MPKGQRLLLNSTYQVYLSFDSICTQTSSGNATKGDAPPGATYLKTTYRLTNESSQYTGGLGDLPFSVLVFAQSSILSPTQPCDTSHQYGSYCLVGDAGDISGAVEAQDGTSPFGIGVSMNAHQSELFDSVGGLVSSSVQAADLVVIGSLVANANASGCLGDFTALAAPTNCVPADLPQSSVGSSDLPTPC